MPSSITHQLIAEEALKRFPPAAAEAVRRAPDEYFLGAQGPDMLFFYRIGSRKEYNYGKYLHRYRVYDVFILFLRALAQDKNDNRIPVLSDEEKTQALSYMLGYITHYCADSAFHPFVYNYLQKTNAPKAVHQQMENDWDVYFLREKRGRENENFSYAFSSKTLIEHKTVARLFRYLAEQLEREEVKDRKLNNGIKNFARYLRFFHKKCYKSQRRWERVEKIFRAKKFMSALYPRENPDPAFFSGEDYEELAEGRGKNADELFDSAVAEAIRLCRLFLDAMNGASLLREDFGKGLLTGKIL